MQFNKYRIELSYITKEQKILWWSWPIRLYLEAICTLQHIVSSQLLEDCGFQDIISGCIIIIFGQHIYYDRILLPTVPKNVSSQRLVTPLKLMTLRSTTRINVKIVNLITRNFSQLLLNNSIHLISAISINQKQQNQASKKAVTLTTTNTH